MLEELKTFRFQHSEMSAEDAAFASALQRISEGHDDEAAERLKTLYTHTVNPRFRSSCAQLLFALFSAKNDWKQIEMLNLFEEPSIERSSRIIGKTISQHQQAVYAYSENSSDHPMTLSLSGCPMMEATVNGRKACLWLDTGAEMTVLSHSLARDCGVSLLPNSALEVENSSNKALNTDFAFIDSIELGSFTVHNQPSLVLSDDLLVIQNPKTNEVITIDGIIGWDIIQHLYLEIDYREKRVMISKPETMDTSENNLFFCGSPIVKVKGENDVPLYFGLDTGANKSHFSQPLLSKMANLFIEKRTVHAGGLNDVKEIEVECIVSLDVYLNDQLITLHNVRKVLADFGAFFTLDGILGSDIGHDARLIIDYKNRRLELVN
ncbi:pepsin/retropepsin-like aspartic protease family protein [Fictibacillus iocasae]|uniref:Pepsin/retropepsin-like aspartic protease family protein n=1 Tax=Fictibacillus iocasae TaxID=2715437 RepID=A0ABW2NRN4_9BACL